MMQATMSSEQVSVIESTLGHSGEVNMGIVGCGYWGPKLIRNFLNLPNVQLRLVADLRQERLDDIRTYFPTVNTTRDYRELLNSNIDAVTIATPVHSHYPLAKAALLAGKHVLVEKPLTARSDLAEELVELAERCGLVLMVGHTFQYNAAVESIREIVHSGQLGKLFYINSTRANLGLLQPDINVMWDLAPRDISILRYILDQDPVSVSARGATYVNTYRNLHEVVYLHLVFDEDVRANVHLSWLDPVKQRVVTIVGSQKMLVYNDINEHDSKVVIYDKGVDVPFYSVTEEEFRASYRHGEATSYPLQWREPLMVECDHFVHCIRNAAVPRSSGRDGLNVVKILETAQRSLQNGGVELKIEY
ncbi:MAG: Gfo/Idh/MocA family oxidoreductase [Chloroflexi bacterium]|nr:Gfo/Idh/MocA family oxidoreductase [Chloroflexota bacterium]